jgi:transporter family protein
MAVFLVLAVLFLGKGSLLSSIDSKAFQFIVLSGLAGALSWFFYFFALKNGPAHGVAALDRLSVVLVLILAAVFLGEGITWKSALGALLITLGAIFMSL